MRCVATGKELPEGSEAIVIRSVKMGAFGPKNDTAGALLAVLSEEFWQKIKRFIDDPNELEAAGASTSSLLEIEHLRKRIRDLENQLEETRKIGDKPDLPELPGVSVPSTEDKANMPGTKTPVQGVDIPEESRGKTTVMDKFQKASRPFLSRLSPGLVNQIIDIADIVDYPHGRVILEDGQVGQALYIVVTGFVEVFKRGKGNKDTVIVILGKGQLFGEMSVLTGEPTSAAVRSRGVARIMVLLKSQIDRLLMENIEINRVFFGLLADRLRSTNISLTEVSSSELRGMLSMMGLIDLVQNLFQAKRTGTLFIKQGSQHIKIGMREGQIQGVLFSDGTEGTHAFAKALQWADGQFSFDDSVVEETGMVGMDTMSFLMDTLRIVDESGLH